MKTLGFLDRLLMKIALSRAVARGVFSSAAAFELAAAFQCINSASDTSRLVSREVQK